MSAIVLYLRYNAVRCVLAALLFTFAVTADVVVKAVVDDVGHDANNPIIWIEHKCDGHYGKATQTPVQPNITSAAALAEATQLFVTDVPALPTSNSARQEAFTPIDTLSSLRC
jgi:hypothetical protein